MNALNSQIGQPQSYTDYCGKCGGTGLLPAYLHIHGGECFHCNGAGRQTYKTTNEHRAKLRAKAAEKRAKKAAEKRQGWEAQRAERVQAFTEKHADLVEFLDANADNNVFFKSLHESIKNRGDLTDSQIDALRNAIKREEERKAVNEVTATVGYIGEEGQRVEIEGVVEAIVKFAGRNWRGNAVEKSIYKIRTDAGHLLTHFTDGALPCKADDERCIAKGDRVAGKVTVKSNEEYKGVPQSTVNRPYLVITE